MRKVHVLTHYSKLECEDGNDRVTTILNNISSLYDVTVITSDFNHHAKKHRSPSILMQSGKYNTVLLHEPGYKKNTSLKRLHSSRVLGRNLKKFFDISEKPDVIYCLSPSLDFATAAIRYAKKEKVNIIVDVQDLWPEAFKLVFNLPIIAHALYYPMRRQALYIYKNADHLVTVSDTYARQIARYMGGRKLIFGDEVTVAYLGTNLSDFDKMLSKQGQEPRQIPNKTTVVYIGTLGRSYNLRVVIDALSLLRDKAVKLLVMGDGLERSELEEYAKNKKIEAEFTGILPYPDMINRLYNCDIAVNPIYDRSAGSIINKVGDYAAAGLPVINTQSTPEYLDLMSRYKIGFNCSNYDSKEMARKMRYLINNPSERRQMGINNRRLAEEKFDRAKTYKGIYDVIEQSIKLGE